MMTLATAGKSSGIEEVRPLQAGLASYYADGLAGRKTANGERYDPARITCAHQKLPFGTMVDVVAVSTGKRVRCRVNDRGPFVQGRILDLSRAAAKDLGITSEGVARIELRIAD